MRQNTKKCTMIFLWLIVAMMPVYANHNQQADFDFIDYQGNTHRLSDYQGKWLILNFWATWCPPCREEIPLLVDYMETHNNVKILGLHYEQGMKREKLDNFRDTYFINYPLIPVTRKIVTRFGNPMALPTTLFISPQGKLIKTYTGRLSQKVLDRIIH